MGIGRATGENRAVEAAKAAIASPLLDVSIDGAKGVLFTIAGGTSLSMHEVNEASKLIVGNADPHAKVIFGAVLDESLKDEIKITVIATGFSGGTSAMPMAFASGTKNIATQAKTSYAPPPPPPKAHKEREREEMPVPSYSAPATSQTKSFEAKTLKREEKPPAKSAQEDEDLEIPAFIRRKLGS